MADIINKQTLKNNIFQCDREILATEMHSFVDSTVGRLVTKSQLPTPSINTFGTAYIIDGILIECVEQSQGVFAWVETKIPKTAGDVGAEPAFSKNSAFNKNFGSAAETVCQGNDSRLSNARTPTAHTHAQSEVTGLVNDLSGKQTEIDTIKEKIPQQANSANKLATEAFVNSTVLNMAANLVTYNANGDSFPTRSAIQNATTVYHNNAAYVPSKNDYAMVLADEGAPAPYTGGQSRWIFTGTMWQFEFGLNTTFTSKQMAALNSGATEQNIESIGNKTNKVNGATSGNFAGLDANGNLTDSGKNTTDFATAEQGTKADNALPNTTFIPTKTSDLENDAGFITAEDGYVIATEEDNFIFDNGEISIIKYAQRWYLTNLDDYGIGTGVFLFAETLFTLLSNSKKEMLIVVSNLTTLDASIIIDIQRDLFEIQNDNPVFSIGPGTTLELSLLPVINKDGDVVKIRVITG